MKAKEKYYILYSLIGIGLVSILGLILFLSESSDSSRVHLPSAALALEHLELSLTEPVTKEILALNPLRKMAGLIEVGKDWKIVSHGVQVMDGPIIIVLKNENGVPSKVIERYRAIRGLNNNIIKEYEVSSCKLNGRAATWHDVPEKLFIVQTFKNNKLNGPIIYYSETGQEICCCDFLNGKLWTGRMLDRDNFGKLNWDISYKDGKLHGQEKYFLEGKLEHLRTFKNGSPDGIQQWYYKAQLRSEEVIENGVRRSHKSWHQNGQLEWEEYYSASGKLDGVRKRWDEKGELILEENYRNGKRHGRFWYKEFPNSEGWYWNGRGAGGKEGFERRQSGK